MIGRRYRLHTTTVTVLCAWNGRTADLPTPLFPHVSTRPHAPRNVQLLLPDGTVTIRPFRGLARLQPVQPTPKDTRL
ncbi:hypothetical protein [Streptacidiphilus sp. EB129]|uniref:hypothetical protein n=1 Tax=Streptacidiphilus sp. EB129 TaxID=3156262 RepID=UPI003517B502